MSNSVYKFDCLDRVWDTQNYCFIMFSNRSWNYKRKWKCWLEIFTKNVMSVLNFYHFLEIFHFDQSQGNTVIMQLKNLQFFRLLLWNGFVNILPILEAIPMTSQFSESQLDQLLLLTTLFHQDQEVNWKTLFGWFFNLRFKCIVGF